MILEVIKLIFQMKKKILFKIIFFFSIGKLILLLPASIWIFDFLIGLFFKIDDKSSFLSFILLLLTILFLLSSFLLLSFSSFSSSSSSSFSSSSLLSFSILLFLLFGTASINKSSYSETISIILFSSSFFQINILTSFKLFSKSFYIF